MQPVNRARISLLQWPLWLFRLHLWKLLGLLLAGLFLSSCVNAELGINFKGQSGGEIVQHIKLADQFTAFNRSTTQQWFDKIKRQTHQLQGRVRQSGQEIEVTIPFGNSTDLEAKLNQFLSDVFEAVQPTSANSQAQSSLIRSDLGVSQQNFLLLLHNRLSYDLDLRSLGVQSIGGDLLLSPDPLVKLEFGLNTPWGARSVSSPADPASTSPVVQQTGHQLVWRLQPGQLNHLEAVFWFPSPLGIGAVAIALVVAGGRYLKYSLFPVAPVSPSRPNP